MNFICKLNYFYHKQSQIYYYLNLKIKLINFYGEKIKSFKNLVFLKKFLFLIFLPYSIFIDFAIYFFFFYNWFRFI